MHGAVSSCVAGSHAGAHGWHAAVSVVLLNVLPVVHGVQVVSALAVPADDCPSPDGQSLCALHAVLPFVSLYVPGPHATQVVSVVAVPATVMPDPAGQEL